MLIKRESNIFCATQDHAAVRDLVNQTKKSTNTNYCVRVTANDGEIGAILREFQDNEKFIPILTTSQKLSTGVDARNIRNIVLMRPVNSMIEFKQIVGQAPVCLTERLFLPFTTCGCLSSLCRPRWDGEAEPDVCGNAVCECSGSGQSPKTSKPKTKKRRKNANQ
jgi:type I restriction enzyme R subunit